MLFIKQFLTWWNGQTLATRFFTWRKGEFVGQDELGNKYYRAKSAIPDSIPEHRWVIYSGYSDGSCVPPGWHGWIHHRVDNPPKDGDYAARPWEKKHQPNLSGTPAAHRPAGSIAQGGKPAEPAPDYQAWRP